MLWEQAGACVLITRVTDRLSHVLGLWTLLLNTCSEVVVPKSWLCSWEMNTWTPWPLLLPPTSCPLVSLGFHCNHRHLTISLLGLGLDCAWLPLFSVSCLTILDFLLPKRYYPETFQEKSKLLIKRTKQQQEDPTSIFSLKPRAQILQGSIQWPMCGAGRWAGYQLCSALFSPTYKEILTPSFTSWPSWTWKFPFENGKPCEFLFYFFNFYFIFPLNQLSYFLLGLGQFFLGMRHIVYCLLLGFGVFLTLFRSTSGRWRICLLMFWDLGLLGPVGTREGHGVRFDLCISQTTWHWRTEPSQLGAGDMIFKTDLKNKAK